ncbi:MAG: SRPBCC family protein [Solirubrobacterales bacterium]|nr:SRPBCC family protein [Solirubrobacterales bacterium]MBV9003270.1 SRPBCC family protein [Solirubrobacterales bacterium]
MKLEQSFDVAAPLERVWQALIDVEQVAPCLPGAAVTGRNDDGTYNGTFSVKIGPTTASYAGKLEMQEVDESAHKAKMHAHGSDKRGQGGATATILSTLSPTDGEKTHVEVVTDYHITGRLARFGRGGMIEDISNKLLRQFADRLQQSLVEEPSGAAAGAGSGAGADAAGAATDDAVAAGGDTAGADAADAGAGISEGAAAQAEAAAGAAEAAQAGAAPGVAEAASGQGGADGGPTSGAGTSGASVGATEGGGKDWAPSGREGPLADTEPPPEPAEPAPSPPGGPEGAPAGGPPGGPGPAGGPPGGPGPAADRPPVAPPPPPPEPAEPIEGLSLMGSVVWGQVRRNPAPIGAFLLGLLVAIVLLRRRRR